MNETIPPALGTQSPTQPPKTSALAIWSLVLGILSLICCTIFAAIPGVICGHMALGRIKRSVGGLSGQGLAIAGLITGYLGIAMAIFVIPLMVAIAIPNFVKAREIAQSNACINNLREIDAAKQQWASENKQATNVIPTMQDLSPYLKDGEESLHCPAGGEYTIGPVGENPTCSIPKHHLPED
ncbi:MAG: DUF4190 domain-containing protein [Limisphaerales bacterium]